MIPYPDGFTLDNVVPVSAFWSYAGGWCNNNIEIQLYTDSMAIVCRDANSANAPFRFTIAKVSEA